ncbi:MAG: TauD/TfdA family dioxygenase [Alphaproteobacteria bacterium]|nr:TauD/TfdA family dioxygenase [Alphaproteobacteria bacterium]
MNTVPYSAFSGQFTRFEARPVSPGIGAELLGTDLANPTDTRGQEVRAALLAYQVVFFRNQDFSRPNSH